MAASDSVREQKHSSDFKEHDLTEVRLCERTLLFYHDCAENTLLEHARQQRILLSHGIQQAFVDGSVHNNG